MLKFCVKHCKILIFIYFKRECKLYANKKTKKTKLLNNKNIVANVVTLLRVN